MLSVVTALTKHHRCRSSVQLCRWGGYFLCPGTRYQFAVLGGGDDSREVCTKKADLRRLHGLILYRIGVEHGLAIRDLT